MICKVCAHKSRADIDAALIAQASVYSLADTYGLSRQSIMRHRDSHMPTGAMQEGARAVQASEATHGATLAQGALALRDKALALLAKAEDAGDLRTALAGVREACRCVELMAKLAGEIDESTTINVAISPQWVAIQTVILSALQPHPEAKKAVVRALEGVQ